MFVFVDIETTGLNPDTDAILEVACIVTSNSLTVIDSYDDLVEPDPVALLNMTNAVGDMHASSGLLTEATKDGSQLEDIDRDLREWLGSITAPNTEPMCGSSVHFDRKFITRHMPLVDNWFHYRNIDVSTLKGLADKWAPGLTREWEMIRGSKPHRALEDCHNSIEELKFYRKRLSAAIGV